MRCFQSPVTSLGVGLPWDGFVLLDKAVGDGEFFYLCLCLFYCFVVSVLTEGEGICDLGKIATYRTMPSSMPGPSITTNPARRPQIQRVTHSRKADRTSRTSRSPLSRPRPFDKRIRKLPPSVAAIAQHHVPAAPPHERTYRRQRHVVRYQLPYPSRISVSSLTRTRCD